jgi:isopenicillin N synthase-like dioxygenase
MSVPLLDLSKYNPNDLLASKEFLDDLYKAMTEVGFFYITNHGVSLELQTKAMQVIKTFFELPLEEKLKVELKNSPHFRGYSRLRKYWIVHLYLFVILTSDDFRCRDNGL